MTIGLDEAGLVLEEIVMLLGIVLNGGFEKKREWIRWIKIVQGREGFRVPDYLVDTKQTTVWMEIKG